MAGCESEVEIKDETQRKALVVLLLINAVMFIAELGLGIYAESTALIADSLDMLADATVYSVGLYAVGRATIVKIRAATISGISQLLLGFGMLAEVTRRLIIGSEPVSLFMMIVGAVALAANVWCLIIVAKHRHGEVHMRASFIFSSNDVIANLGVVSAGALVLWLGERWPDLVIGVVISLIVIVGGIHILREARQEKELISSDATQS